jgi:hypothetical protein
MLLPNGCKHGLVYFIVWSAKLFAGHQFLQASSCYVIFVEALLSSVSNCNQKSGIFMFACHYSALLHNIEIILGLLLGLFIASYIPDLVILLPPIFWIILLMQKCSELYRV